MQTGFFDKTKVNREIEELFLFKKGKVALNQATFIGFAARRQLD